MNVCVIPKKILNRFGFENALAVNLLLSNIFLLFAMSVYLAVFSLSHVQNFGFCIVQKLFQIPCIGCGMSRAALCFWRGDIVRAMQWNVAVVPFLGAIFIQILLQNGVIKGSVTQEYAGSVSRAFEKLLVLTLVCVWIIRLIPTQTIFNNL